MTHLDYFVYDLSPFMHIIEENIQKVSACVCFMFMLNILNLQEFSYALNSKLDQVQHIHTHVDLFTEESNLLKVYFSLSLPRRFASDQHINNLKDTNYTLNIFTLVK